MNKQTCYCRGQILLHFDNGCEMANYIELVCTCSKQEFNELLNGLILDEENGETVEKFPWKTTEDEMLLLKEKV